MTAQLKFYGWDETAMALNPYRFALAAGIQPDPWQREVLEQSFSPRILLNCTRQGGKSTVTSVVSAHAAIYQPNTLILMISKAQRQSQELFRKALDVWRAVGSPYAGPQTSATTLELRNGSRIVALPGSEGSIRSFSAVGLLLLDEASRIPDEVYLAMRPVIAVSGGRVIALSTPFGRRGWWYEEWRGAESLSGYKDVWKRWQVPASACPRITPEFLEEEKRHMGRWWFTQEYMCQFLDAQTAAFTEEEIQRAFSEKYDTWRLEEHADTFAEEQRREVEGEKDPLTEAYRYSLLEGRQDRQAP